MLKNKKFIIGGILITLAIVFLVVLGFKNLTYYYEVNEVLTQGDSLTGKTIRVAGEVAPDIEREVGTLRFTIIDFTNENTTLPVVYQGPVPDTFQVGREIVIEGKYISGGVFDATSIITKCASKYQPEATPKK